MRINFFGGPGTGKSTLAARIFAELRRRNILCSLVPEWIKNWAYQGRPIQGFDQVFSFANQLYMEEEALRYTNLTITDSPLFLQCMYADKHAQIIAKQLWDIARIYESVYPSMNFYVDRSGGYETEGRYENEEQATQMDDHIKTQLTVNNISAITIQRDDVDRVIQHVLQYYK